MFTKQSLFVGGRRACLLAAAESGRMEFLSVAETPIQYTEETHAQPTFSRTRKSNHKLT